MSIRTGMLTCFLLLTLPASAHQPYDSIQRFSVQNDENIQLWSCTTWAVRPEDRVLWVVPYHCLTDENGVILLQAHWKIGKQSVQMFRLAPLYDLALLTGGPAPHGLRISFSQPSVRQAVYSVGYPHGSTVQHVMTGTFSNIDEDGRAIFGLPVAEGFSGGPILDHNNMVVGVVLQQECPLPGNFCAVTRAATVDQLRAVVFGESA